MVFLLDEVSLTAIPMSKNIEFGKDDIDEMLFLLEVIFLIYKELKFLRNLKSRKLR